MGTEERRCSQAVVAQAFNSSTWEAEAGGLWSEFQDSQGYPEEPCVENRSANVHSFIREPKLQAGSLSHSSPNSLRKGLSADPRPL